MSFKKSKITRAISLDGTARAAYIDSTEIVKEACRLHNLSKTMSAVLGRVLTGASLMGTQLKNENDSLTLRFDGNGPAGSIVCVADYMGNVKGYADNPDLELKPKENGRIDVSGAVGSGNMYVIKDLGLKEPYIGISKIVSGEIAEDITNYYASSEQTPTVCALGIRFDDDGNCFAAGGYLLQLMPGADEEIISALEKNIGKMPPVSRLISEGKKDEYILSSLFDSIPFEYFDEFEAQYQCSCSRQKYLNSIVSLSDNDINEIVEKKEDVEAICSFCGKKYVFTPKEIIEHRKNKNA